MRKTVREKALEFGRKAAKSDHPLHFERRDCPGCYADVWLAGWQAAKKDKKKETTWVTLK